jgi:large subunit ribosomal protein L19
MNPIIQEITASQVKNDITPFKVGDGVRVHTKVREGDKERVQVYAGIVIARKGHGVHETFTVRRLSYGEGVERVFPVNSPNIEKIEVERESEPMRARLYYLRRRTGKAAMAIKEKDRSALIHAEKLAAAARSAANAKAPSAKKAAAKPASEVTEEATAAKS